MPAVRVTGTYNTEHFGLTMWKHTGRARAQPGVHGGEQRGVQESLPRNSYLSLDGGVEASQEKGLGREKHSRQKEQHGQRPRDEKEHDTLARHTCIWFSNLSFPYFSHSGSWLDRGWWKLPLSSLRSLLPSSCHSLMSTISFSLKCTWMVTL